MADLLVEIGLASCWGLVALVWIAGALLNARLAPRRPVRDRSGLIAYVALTAICAAAVALGYETFHGFSFDAGWARYLGLGVLVACCAFSIRARLALGTMWSVDPEVGGDRRLRMTGPYAVTRHPIYSGLLGMVIGTTLLAGGHEFVVIVVAVFFLFEFKIHREERLLLATYPNQYREYRQRVPQLVPGLRRGSGGRERRSDPGP
jgi:protein-S-isoprenylcysteine O-methyltransferase Ste14